LKRYRQAAEHAAEENATLLSRLAEAFKYIGSVNVEIQEIRSILCGIDCHPRSRKEFQRCLDRLATKAMAIAGSDWLVIRVIDGCDGRTVKECTAQRRKGARPPATMGNRDILEGRRIEGIVAIGLQPRNFDLLTVCLLPAPPLAEAERLLVTVVLNQFEMLYRLHRAGCRPHPARLATNEKETHHVHHC
jgi:hypothetical protein